MKKIFMHPKSIIFRLCVSFLLLIVPLELTGLFFLSWSNSRIKEEIKTTNLAAIHYLSQNIQTELTGLSNHITPLINNTMFSQFSTNSSLLSTSEYYINLLDQVNLLKQYSYTYALIDDIRIYYPALNLSVSATSSVYTVSPEQINELLGSIHNTDTIIKQNDSTLFLSSLYPVNTRYTQKMPTFFIVLELSRDTFTGYLDTSSKNYDTIFYLHEQQEVLCPSKMKDTSRYEAYIQQIDELVSSDATQTVFSLSDSEYYIIAEYSPTLQCTVMQFIPIREVFKTPNTLSRFLVIYILVSLLILFIFCYIVFKLIAHPVEALLQGYRNVEDKNYAVTISCNTSSSEFQLLIQGFNHMTTHLQQSIEQLYYYQIYTQKMELKQLQMQMNPHFLYNTYYILHRLIQSEDTEQAALLSSYLGSYFQYITRNSQDLVPLQKEWEHAENYLRIQEIRFCSRIAFKIDTLPEEYAEFSVPRLILQPLLENALEHGLKNVPENGKIAMQFFAGTKYFEIVIRDNGNTLTFDKICRLNEEIHTTDTQNKEYTALHNIHKRLQLIYGSSGGLTLTPNHGCGLCVHIIIPKNSFHEKNEVTGYESIKCPDC